MAQGYIKYRGSAEQTGRLPTNQWPNVTQTLLSVLPGGPTNLQIAAGSLTDTAGRAVTCTRSSTKYCLTGASQDPAQLLVNPEVIANGGGGPGVWSAPLTTFTNNYAPDPAGYLVAARLQISANSNRFASLVKQQVSKAIAGGSWSGVTVTFSAYVRATSGTSPFALQITWGGVNDYYSADFTATSSWQRFTFTQAFPVNASTQDAYAGFAQSTALNGADIVVAGLKFEIAASASAYNFNGQNNQAIRLLSNNQIAVEPSGILVEGAATNLQPWSQNLATDGAHNWANGGNAQGTANTAIAPDGTMTASTIAMSGGTAGSKCVFGNVTGLTASTTYTMSVWLWVASGTLGVRISRTNTTAWATATVSPTLTLTTTPTRYTLTYSTAVGETASAFVIGSENKTPFVPADGSFFAWQGQHEVGSIATSPILTTNATASRSADTITWGTISLGNTSGTAQIQVTPSWSTNTGANGGALFVANNGSQPTLLYTNNNDTRVNSYDGTNAMSVPATWTAGVPRKYRTTWNPTGRTEDNLTDGYSASTVALVPVFSSLTLTASNGGAPPCWLSDLLVTR